MTTTTAPESVASGCARVRWGTRADGFRRFRRLAVECMIGGRGETPDGVHHRESARRGTTKRMVLDDDYRGKPLHRESTQRQGGLGRRSARAQQRHHTSRRIVSVRRCGCAGDRAGCRRSGSRDALVVVAGRREGGRGRDPPTLTAPEERQGTRRKGAADTSPA